MMALAPAPTTAAVDAPRRRLTLLIRDLGYGGAQRQLVTLAIALHGKTFDVTVVHFYPGALAHDLESAGVPHIEVGKNGRWDLPRFFIQLRRTLRATRPDVLHSYLTESNVMASLCRSACGNPAVVWGIRDSESDAHQWGLLGRASAALARRLSHRADALIANSHAGRDWYLQHGYPEATFHVVPNGIDTDRFQPTADPRATPKLRSQWGATTGTFLLGCIGRLDPMKDHHTLLHAVAQLGSRHPQLRLVIIGRGDPAFSAELQAHAVQLGLRDRVHWSPPRDDMPQVLTALDGVVSSSAFGEGFSNVLGEAMACETPCIATDVGDAARLLTDTGFLCPPRQPAALAAAIQQLLMLTPEKRTRLGERARLSIEESFAPRHLLERTNQLLHTLTPR